MKFVFAIVAGVAVVGLLAGCGGSSSNATNAPTAVDDAATSVPAAPVTINVTANDTDRDGTIDSTTVAIVAAPSNGTASVNPTTGAITYTADATFAGMDTVMYTVNDNNGTVSNSATITVTVTTMPMLMSLVQQLLAAAANSEPTPVNNLAIQNQLDAGDPLPVGSFSPSPTDDK